ncbi:hypothetical protein CC84DRAFT_1135818, partial [Paraphaeosphaeria sporulosa]
TYDHRTLKTRLPVRSAIYKQCTGGSVVAWVTSSESPLLYVFFLTFWVCAGAKCGAEIAPRPKVALIVALPLAFFLLVEIDLTDRLLPLYDLVFASVHVKVGQCRFCGSFVILQWPERNTRVPDNRS